MVMRPFTRTLLQATFAAGALTLLVHLVDVAEIVATGRSASPLWIGAAVALLPINLGLEGWGWRVLLRDQVPGAGLRVSCASVLAGHSLGLTTPVRAGEPAGRVLALTTGEAPHIVALALVQRLVAMAVGVGLGLPAFAVFLGTSSSIAGSAGWLVAGYAGLVLVLLAAVLLHVTPLLHLLRRLAPGAWLRRRIGSPAEVPRRRLLRVTGIEAVRYGVYLTQFVLLLAAFSPTLAVPAAFVGVSVVFFFKFLVPPLTLYDLGVREAAAVFVLGALGFSQPAAFNASLLLFGINLLVAALLGAAFLSRRLSDRQPSLAKAVDPVAPASLPGA